MTAGVLVRATRRATTTPGADPGRVTGLGWLLAAELMTGALGFSATVHLARRLGPVGFGHLEFASAVAAWLLVIVRSGIEQIVYREAGRRPRLIGPLTDLLLGLKCAGAVVGLAAVLALAAWTGPGRGGAVAVAGLVLIPSALVADVAPRAEGRLGVLAMAQGLRGLGYAGTAWMLVSTRTDLLRAAGCAAVGESLSGLVLFAAHLNHHGFTRPRYRGRAWSVLLRRGAVASLIRFGRVGLYAADLLVMAAWTSAEAGPYAAARRLVFALVALGLIVPSAVAPRIARAWAAGESPARRVVSDWVHRLLSLALPAAVGMMMTADRAMPRIFGPAYQDGGLWLILIAARLPWLLAASTAQATLIACRREADALRLVALMAILGLATLPAGAALAGLRGVCLALLAVEVAGAVIGWFALRRLGIAPTTMARTVPPVLGCAALLLVCRISRNLPLEIAVGAGAAVYGVVWWMGNHRICQNTRLMRPNNPV